MRKRADLREGEAGVVMCREIISKDRLRETVPETNTGRREEYSKAYERTRVKELGKMHT
jgi:hypothetical protein